MIHGVPETFVAMAPIALMVLYFAGTSLTIANYAGYMRFNNDVYGDGFVRAYLVFTIFGAIGYYLAAGPAWLWAAKYSDTYGQRVRRTSVGMGVIFFLHDLPCFIMEWHAVLCCGWRNDFQSFVFIVQILEFAVSFGFGWLGYTYVLSGYLENNFGNSSLRTTGGGGLKTGADVVQILPPMSAASTPMLGSNSRGGQYSPREPQAVNFPTPAPAGGSRGSYRETRTPLSATGSVRWASTDGPSPRAVPLREDLADKRDLDESDDDSLDGDDAYYAAQRRKAASGFTLGGPSPRGAAPDSRTYTFDRGAAPQRYEGGTHAGYDVEMDPVGRAPSHASSRGQPLSYSLPPMSVSGSRGGAYAEDDTPPTAPSGPYSSGAPRRLGSVFIERTTI